MAGKFKKLTQQNEEQEREPIQLGAGLLNDVSKSFEVDREERVYIDMSRLQANSKNEYSVEDLEDLADAIKMAGGILQDLIVKPMDEDGYYYITTGERRWRAAQLLRDRGEYPGNHGNKVPCQIRDPQALELPLSDESKEDFSILVTNRYREKTDSDLFMEMKKWKKIFGELREQGIEYLTATKYEEDVSVGSSEKEGIQIKGVPTRNLVAQQLGVSTGQVSKMEAIERNASPSVLNGFMDNEIKLSEAEKISQLPQKVQEELMDEISQESKTDLKEKIRKHAEVTMTLTREQIQQSLDRLMTRIQEEIPGEQLELTDAQYKEYRKRISRLESFFREV